MEWHQLIYFKRVAEFQHMTKAAESLTISQPALSRSIARLEDELGFSLFERRGKNVILSQYGRIFLKHVERAIKEIEVGKQNIQNLMDPDYGTVSIAFIHSLGSNMLPNLLGVFHSQYPQIQFKLSQNSSHLMLDELMEGKIDLCIFSSYYQPESVESISLFQEEIFAVVADKHPLAKQSSICMKDIANEPIISLKRDYGLRILMEQIFAKAGITPQVAFEGDEIWTLVGLVEAGLGVALVPRISGSKKYGIRFLPIRDQKCCRTVQLAWVKERYLSPVARKFKDFILYYFS